MNTIQIGGETLITPNELAKAGIISLPQQWALRRKGALKCYRNGAKVFYSWTKHIEPYLSDTEQSKPTDNENIGGE